MTAVETRPPLYVGRPFLRTLKLVVAPVPEPTTAPIARSYNDHMTVLRMHPNLPAEPIVDYAVHYLTREECRLWLSGFGVWPPCLDQFYANPWRYLHHLRHVRSIPENIPPALKI